ncbi:MAG: helix-turn-helix transcriptional regulator [Sphingomonadaceae bacterium]|nr:helix-turn-helix transcriptional regulator [Sphingomonadaceae bacterium]
MLSPLQSRLARAALGWSIREAASAAGVGFNTLARFEVGGDTYSKTLQKIADAYTASGVTFLSAGETSLAGGEGVRFVPRDPEADRLPTE